MPGLLPNLKIAAEFSLSAAALPTTTLAVAGSPLAGGMRNRETGYAIAAAVEMNPASAARRGTSGGRTAGPKPSESSPAGGSDRLEVCRFGRRVHASHRGNRVQGR